MATTGPPTNPLGSAQAHIQMCEKHDLTIDMTCEDCDVFICSQCAKSNHKDHDWKTLSAAGRIRRIELKKTLDKVKAEDIKEMDEKIKNVSKQIEENYKYSNSEVSKLQKHFDAIVSKLNRIKKSLETKLKEDVERKNAEVIDKKFDLQKQNEQIKNTLKFLEESHSTMSDYSLIENIRNLTSLMSNRDNNIEKGNQPVRFRRGNINEGLLESMMGETIDLDDITVIETDSFQYGNKRIAIMETINEDISFVGDSMMGYIEKVDKRNRKKKINIGVNDVCVTDDGNVYATDYKKKSIVRLLPSGSVSTEFSTAPLEPVGICQSTLGGLLVTLKDIESKPFELDSNRRRLIRHVTLTGDVIREYEYQEDGQTRLFTVPHRVKQNGNTDICVVNRTSEYTGKLLILSYSGFLESVYQGRKLGFQFNPSDVVCDSDCNIIVCDYLNSKTHLLSPDGEFMKYLLTEIEVACPFSFSLHKSTLWVGNEHGLVKVFQYYNKN